MPSRKKLPYQPPDLKRRTFEQARRRSMPRMSRPAGCTATRSIFGAAA